jgi:hypothetical protein
MLIHSSTRKFNVSADRIHVLGGGIFKRNQGDLFIFQGAGKDLLCDLVDPLVALRYVITHALYFFTGARL